MSTPEPVAAEAPVASRGLLSACTAFIIGIIALVMAFVPVLSWLAWIPAAAAIVIGMIALRREPQARKKALNGLVMGAAAWVIAIVVSVSGAVAMFAPIAAQQAGAAQEAGDQYAEAEQIRKEEEARLKEEAAQKAAEDAKRAEEEAAAEEAAKAEGDVPLSGGVSQHRAGQLL